MKRFLLAAALFMLCGRAVAAEKVILSPPAGAEEEERKKLAAAALAVKGAEVMEARTFTESDSGETMPYRLFKVGHPEPGKKYPLVLLLHHATRGGDDNLRHIREDMGVGVFCLPATQAKFPCYVLAPQAGGGGRPEAWSDVQWTGLSPRQPWPENPNRNMRLALAILDSVIEEFPVDKGRIYISGASMGSYGTHDAITRRPEFFAGAITICGGYTPMGAPHLLETPLWTFHGDRDETIDVQQSRQLFEAVEGLKGQRMIYWEYRGVNHGFARDLAYTNPRVLEWLFARKRDLTPPLRANFPLQISANRRHLVDERGTPFLVVGDTAWSLIPQLTEQEAREYLDDRRQRGFNALIVSLIEHKFTTKAPATIEGVQPFLAPGDFTQPNPAYFEHAHRVIELAHRRGLSIWLAPAYLGVNGGGEGFFQEIKQAGPAALRGYGQFVGEKFRDLPNIVWMPGGDYAMPAHERWAAHELALGLREGGAKQLMTAHGCQLTAAANFGDPEWLDVDNVYSYQSDQWREHHANYRHAKVRPSVLIEALYENEYQDKTDPAKIRRQAWWAMTAGACGQFFGNAPLWHLGGPGYKQSNKPWREALDLAGSRDHARLGAFFRRLQWASLEPDLDDKLVAAGGGGGETKVTAARTPDGKLAVLYIPPTGQEARALTLNLASFAAPLRVSWFNPAKDAAPKTPETPLANRDGEKLRTPGDNGTGANDWVLTLEAK